MYTCSENHFKIENSENYRATEMPLIYTPTSDGNRRAIHEHQLLTVTVHKRPRFVLILMLREEEALVTDIIEMKEEDRLDRLSVGLDGTEDGEDGEEEGEPKLHKQQRFRSLEYAQPITL